MDDAMYNGFYGKQTYVELSQTRRDPMVLFAPSTRNPKRTVISDQVAIIQF